MIALKLVGQPEGDAMSPSNGVEGGALSIRKGKAAIEPENHLAFNELQWSSWRSSSINPHFDLNTSRTRLPPVGKILQ
ncbi:MAG: hypothetical protein K2X93_25300 [Candidatus Obscuribacterales bacterium]|nr:hypothetical protein [Candidatus Obscuribacterales bacterium]